MESFEVRIDPGPGPQVRLYVGRAHAPATGPPQLVETAALVDTGSAFTFIDRGLLDALGLKPRGTQTAANPVDEEGATRDYPVYDVELHVCEPLSIGRPRGAILSPVRVLGGRANRRAQAVSILGRDVLSHMVVIFDGPRGRMIVSF